MDVVVSTQQVTEREMNIFLDSVTGVLSQRDAFSHSQRWDITAQGGRIFISRTRDGGEFTLALDGVRRVANAIRNKQDIEGVVMLVRGKERFYDIQGLPGLSGRAWIGFDLRQLSAP